MVYCIHVEFIIKFIVLMHCVSSVSHNILCSKVAKVRVTVQIALPITKGR